MHSKQAYWPYKVLLTTFAVIFFWYRLIESPTPSGAVKNRKMNTMSAVRPIARVIKGQKMMEGAGVQIFRTIGTNDIRVDPYLMLDELKLPASQATAGFPDHPHRGFETCTIVLSGKVEHRDSVGNHGVIGPGGVQWMTAGRGIVHSEFPATLDGDLHGFQLWINLPAKDKMVKPRYQDLQADQIPTASFPGGSVRVMAGTSGGMTGPLKLRNPGMLLDVRLEAGAQWTQEVPAEWNGFAYVYEGNGRLSGESVAIQHAYIFGEGNQVAAQAGDAGLRLLLVVGKPIKEPIVQCKSFIFERLHGGSTALTAKLTSCCFGRSQTVPLS